MQNKENYFVIDNNVIRNNNNIIFNLYRYDSNTKSMSVIYEKGMGISKSHVATLLSYSEIYAEIDNETFYDEFYQNPIEQKLIPSGIQGFYQNISKNINELFDNPESFSNVKKVDEIVTDMIVIIEEDDFTVSSFVTILTYNYYAHTHSLNVSIYALCLAKHMGIKKDNLQNLGTAALLHDLGKGKIDNTIINKKGKLTDSEFNEVKKHPFYGWQLAKKLGIDNEDILRGIYCHHEKIDGTGYPKGLKKDDIPLFARIISICDTFDSMTTKRSYKDSVGTFDTLILMKTEMSNNFDSNIINNFIQMLKAK